MNEYEKRYLLGQTYETLAGNYVKVIHVGDKYVECDDNVCRYDRLGVYEDGRVVGTSCYPPDPRNFRDGAWLKHGSTISKIMSGYEPVSRSGRGFDTAKAQRRTAIALDILLDKSDMMDLFKLFDRLDKL